MSEHFSSSLPYPPIKLWLWRCELDSPINSPRSTHHHQGVGQQASKQASKHYEYSGNATVKSNFLTASCAGRKKSEREGGNACKMARADGGGDWLKCGAALMSCKQTEYTHNLGSKFNRAQYILNQGLWGADLVRSTDADVNIPQYEVWPQPGLCAMLTHILVLRSAEVDARSYCNKYFLVMDGECSRTFLASACLPPTSQSLTNPDR